MLIECEAFGNRIGCNCDSFRLDLHNGQLFGELGGVDIKENPEA